MVRKHAELQTLAQSVFGNLLVLNTLHLLAGVQSEEGLPAFFSATPSADVVTLDRRMRDLAKYLHEPITTSVDIFIAARPVVAVECKLMEAEVGDCSRPRLPKDDDKYCNGGYVHRTGWTTRCSLAEKSGVRYWDYVPQLFPRWRSDIDHERCPLRPTYQLVRNVLAACLRPDGRLDPTAGHALLLYDGRNPAFGSKGGATQAYEQARAALVDPSLLRRCSWQRLIASLERDDKLGWLLGELKAKYGLGAPETARPLP